MKIGDMVEYRDMVGVIVGEIIPKCRCKDRVKWIIQFEGRGTTSTLRKNNIFLIKKKGIHIKEGLQKFNFNG